MRKEAGFEVMDRIRLTHEGSEVLEKVFANRKEEIASEVLAREVSAAAPAGYVKEWNINGEKVTLGVEKL